MPSTTVGPSTESTTQGKPTTPVVSSPTSKQVTKQVISIIKKKKEKIER